MYDPRQEYELGIWVTPDSVETYTFVNSDGDSETRVEQLYTSWYVSTGEQVEPWALFLEGDFFADGAWRAPSRKECEVHEPGVEAGVCQGTWYAVVRDRRGGMTWVTRQWRFRGDGP